MNNPTLTSNDPDFWRVRYQEKLMPWDLGGPSPIFNALLSQPHHLIPAQGKVAVVGCGAGHDAALFGRHGYTVTGMDYTPEAISLAKDQYSDWAQFIQLDIFNLPPEQIQQYDIVVEHTLFCAIWPKRRAEYVKAMSRLLKPKGWFVGIFWMHGETGGPPYSTSVEEVQTYFSTDFTIYALALSPYSIPQRHNQEWLGTFQKI